MKYLVNKDEKDYIKYINVQLCYYMKPCTSNVLLLIKFYILHQRLSAFILKVEIDHTFSNILSLRKDTIVLTIKLVFCYSIKLHTCTSV